MVPSTGKEKEQILAFFSQVACSTLLSSAARAFLDELLSAAWSFLHGEEEQADPALPQLESSEARSSTSSRRRASRSSTTGWGGRGAVPACGHCVPTDDHGRLRRPAVRRDVGGARGDVARADGNSTEGNDSEWARPKNWNRLLPDLERIFIFVEPLCSNQTH
jgi:hypothetical protein